MIPFFIISFFVVTSKSKKSFSILVSLWVIIVIILVKMISMPYKEVSSIDVTTNKFEYQNKVFESDDTFRIICIKEKPFKLSFETRYVFLIDNKSPVMVTSY